MLLMAVHLTAAAALEIAMLAAIVSAERKKAEN